eukprot:213544-Prymnesium_polylepis.1
MILRDAAVSVLTADQRFAHTDPAAEIPESLKLLLALRDALLRQATDQILDERDQAERRAVIRLEASVQQVEEHPLAILVGVASPSRPHPRVLLGTRVQPDDTPSSKSKTDVATCPRSAGVGRRRGRVCAILQCELVEHLLVGDGVPARHLPHTCRPAVRRCAKRAAPIDQQFLQLLDDGRRNGARLEVKAIGAPDETVHAEVDDAERLPLLLTELSFALQSLRELRVIDELQPIIQLGRVGGPDVKPPQTQC